MRTFNNNLVCAFHQWGAVKGRCSGASDWRGGECRARKEVL